MEYQNGWKKNAENRKIRKEAVLLDAGVPNKTIVLA